MQFRHLRIYRWVMHDLVHVLCANVPGSAERCVTIDPYIFQPYVEISSTLYQIFEGARGAEQERNGVEQEAVCVDLFWAY
jgi:hypothetical protein